VCVTPVDFGVCVCPGGVGVGEVGTVICLIKVFFLRVCVYKIGTLCFPQNPFTRIIQHSVIHLSFLECNPS